MPVDLIPQGLSFCYQIYQPKIYNIVAKVLRTSKGTSSVAGEI